MIDIFKKETPKRELTEEEKKEHRSGLRPKTSYGKR